MSYPYYELVQKAHNELVASGHIKKLPPGHQEEVEQQKGLLTQRAGYYSNLRDNNIGVLEKSSGNNYKGYSVDILIQKDGTFWDIATDDGTQALPVNGGPSFDSNLAPRWRQPTKELAGLENGEPIPEPPPDDISEKLDQIITNQSIGFGLIEQQNQVLAQIQETLNQHTVLLQQIIDTGSSGKFPIIYPSYSFTDLFGRRQTMLPTPPTNP